MVSRSRVSTAGVRLEPLTVQVSKHRSKGRRRRRRSRTKQQQQKNKNEGLDGFQLKHSHRRKPNSLLSIIHEHQDNNIETDAIEENIIKHFKLENIEERDNVDQVSECLQDDHSLDSKVAMFDEDVMGAETLVLVTMTESLHEVMEEESVCEESYFYGCQFFLCDQECQDHNE